MAQELGEDQDRGVVEEEEDRVVGHNMHAEAGSIQGVARNSMQEVRIGAAARSTGDNGFAEQAPGLWALPVDHVGCNELVFEGCC